jgi:hypothetical protein
MAITTIPVTGRQDLEASTDAFRSVLFPICTSSGLPVTGWSSGDALTVQVWRGDDQEQLDDTGLNAAWSDAPNGIVKIYSDGTHSLSSASYQWRCLATTGGLTYEIVRGNYAVLHAPGSVSNTIPASQRPYTTIDDLRTIAPWIEQARSEFDQAGFLEQQIAARQWFDQIVIRSWSNRNGTVMGSYNTQYWGTPYELSPQWLTDVIATGKGIQITPAIKRACAAYACSLICVSQLSVKDDSSGYRRKAAEFRNAAASLVASMTVRIKSSSAATTYDSYINTNVSVRN